MIHTGVMNLRDPFLLRENGTYYLFGTGVKTDWEEGCLWTAYKNRSGRLSGEWEKIGDGIAEIPADAVKNRWAPEVHKYGESYYMIASYYSAERKHRGCSILKSSSPEGRFVEISGGHITPKDWDAIDGTLYADREGNPYLVFVHEWTNAPGQVGTFAYARMSDDLTHFVSEPVEIFRADEPIWANDNRVTDGCFMYETKKGSLLMIWSGFSKDGYVVAISRSDNGTLAGNWSHEEKLLFDKSRNGLDGGHGMIFTDTDGEMYLCIHSPNNSTEEVVFVPIREENDTLVAID